MTARSGVAADAARGVEAVDPAARLHETADETMSPATDDGGHLPPISARVIVLLIVATFGTGMAMIVPMAYSLAVRLNQIAPGRVDVLGIVLGVGAASTLVVAPLTGILSDRLRSRWGRRRPFTVAGTLLGLVSVPIMAMAPDAVVLTIGWICSTVGWSTAGASIGNWQADRLPPQQRGKVSGMTGLTMQIAPVAGILLVGLVRDQILWVFALPALFGLVFVIGFVFFVHDPDTRAVVPATRLTVGRVVRSYAFRPRAFPDFSWNWAGRFVFFLGLTLTTSLTVFFYAQRLGLPVPDVAGVMALTSGLSVATAFLGSLGGGWLSDRTARRRPFVLLGAALFAAGCLASAWAHDLPTLLVGSLFASLGIATFSAVGQALNLDVLPHRDTEAGRYMAITLVAQKIPGVIAPVAAPLVLALGGGGQNFFALYLVAAVFAVAGGLTIAVGVRGVR